MEGLIIQEPEIRDTIMREAPNQPPESTQEELFYRQASQLGTDQKIKFYLKLHVEVIDFKPKNQTELQFCEQYEFAHTNHGNKGIIAEMIQSGLGGREFLEVLRTQKPAPSPATKPSTLSDV